MKVDLVLHDTWLSKKMWEAAAVYAKDIREVNKEETVSRSYIVAKFVSLDATA